MDSSAEVLKSPLKSEAVILVFKHTHVKKLALQHYPSLVVPLPSTCNSLNFDFIFHSMSNMPGIMSRMPALPLSINNELANSILPGTSQVIFLCSSLYIHILLASHPFYIRNQGFHRKSTNIPL